MAPTPEYTLPLVAGRDGELLLKVRAAPGAKRDAVLGLHGDALRVAVRAPPEKGKANEAVSETIAGWLGLPRREVSVHGGQGSRDKWIRIGSVTREELVGRLRMALGR
jgi:uncharacterized protein